jgi:hypothetical protein
VSLAAIVCVGVFGVALIRDRAAFSGEGRAPVLRVSEKTMDAGTVDPWEMLEHIFTVFNDGGRVLRIDRVSPD